jgi:transcriptional regulator with XRE-family HTH domain
MIPSVVFMCNLNHYRCQQGLTQSGLAEIVSTLSVDDFTWHPDQTAITRIEGGQRSVKIDEAAILALALKVDLWSMLSVPANSGGLPFQRVAAARKQIG